MDKIIWLNGCFDILHIGHIKLFEFAKSKGGKVYVGVDSDEKVKKDKGFDRPFNKLDDRVNFLSSIKFIDKIFTFDTTEGLEKLIQSVSPDIMILGSDWKDKTVIGEEYAKELVFFDRIPGYSTTKILESKKL